MKKILLVVLLLVILAVAYVGYTKVAKKSAEVATNTAKTMQQAMFGSIKEALSKSLTLQCTFTDPHGRQTTAYIKAGAVRVDFVAKDPMQSGSVIMKDKKIYYWNNKQGYMMEMPSVTPLQTSTQPSLGVEPTDTQKSASDMLAMLEKYKNNCKPAVIGNSLFTPPSDVIFQDITKMMPSVMPPGTGSTNENAVPTQYQQYMQQYHITPPSSGY